MLKEKEREAYLVIQLLIIFEEVQVPCQILYKSKQKPNNFVNESI